MKKVLLIAIIIGLIPTYSSAQYAIGHSSFTFIDPSRFGREIGIEIYYPAELGGEDVAVAEGPKFPFVIMSHGFLMTFDAYENIWEALVPNGYIVVLPTTAGELLPDHENYGRDIAFLSARFSKLSKYPPSIFYNRIRNRCAAMGHSMGGGATFLAASYPNRISTTITFAAAETSPSAIDASSGVPIPSLVFAAGDDCVTPSATNQLPMYEALPAMCKTYISVDGGTHCQFADYNFNCSLGELFCGSGISRNEQHETVNAFLIPWLDFYLKNSSPSFEAFNELLTSTTGISYLQSCDVRIGEPTQTVQIEVYPNPVGDWLNIQVENSIQLEIYSLSGQQMISAIPDSDILRINTKDWPSGIYIIKNHQSDDTIGSQQFLKE